jgi:nitrogen fixation/metabolism regulation signal transduction histidine kinase
MVFSELNVLITQIATSAQLTTIVNRLYEVVISISAVIIAVLWIPIAISFFGSDENRRFEARARLKNALIGTFIYVVAISGVLYAVVNYIVTGS